MIDLPADDFHHPFSRAVSLRRLPQGQPARVVQLSGRPEYVHRLLEFGFRPGCCFEVVRRGNPCIVRMDGTRFCLRTGRRLDVLVELLDQEPAAGDRPPQPAPPTPLTD